MPHATATEGAPLSGQSFSSWAFSTVQRIRKAVGIGALFAAAFSIKNLVPDAWFAASDADLKAHIDANIDDRQILAVIQAATCIALALLTPRPSTERLASRRKEKLSADELATSVKACRRIQLFVVAAYFAWALYYLFTAMSMSRSDLFTRAFSLSLNTIPSVLLFWLYLELAELTVGPERVMPVPNGGREVSTRRSVGIGDALYHRVVSLSVLAVVVALAWYAQGVGEERGIMLLDVCSSCLNGVSLALVVGRLGSKYIDPGAITLGLLYFYAVIQPTAPMFAEWPLLQLIATTVALPLKVLLWLVCVWAFTSGIMAEYVHEIRVLLTQESDRPKAE